MAFEQRNNSGTLFKNDKKESPSQPDYRGSALIGGVDYWVSGWIKTPKNGGEKFMSFSYQPKEDKGAAPKNSGREDPPASESLIDDDMPF